MKCKRPVDVFVDLFGSLGYVIGKHPVYFLVIPFLVVLSLAYPFVVGFIDFRRTAASRAGSVDLYTPKNGQSIYDRIEMAKVFPDGGYFTDRTVITPNLFIILVSAKDGGSVLRPNIFAAYYDLRLMIEDLTIEYNGEQLKYDTFCRQDPMGEICIPDPFINLWKARSLGLVSGLSYPFVQFSSTIDQVDPTDGSKMYIGPLFGGVQSDDQDRIIYAKYVRLIVNLPKSYFHLDVFEAYSQRFTEFVQNFSRCDQGEIDVAYWSAQQYAKDMHLISKRVMHYLPSLLIIILVFSIASCCMLDAVLSKPILAAFGVISALFGIMCGFATLFLLSFQIIEIAMVVPFLVLSIGVDDMFVMLSVWRKTCSCLSIPERLSITYKESAVSITVTTLTDASVFAIGISSVFEAVKIFCTLATACIIWVFLFQLTYFGAWLAYTGRREAAGRHCIAFCKTSAAKSGSSHCRCKGNSEYYETGTTSTGSSSMQRKKDDSERQPWPSIFFKVYYAPCLASIIVRMSAVLSYLLYASASIAVILTSIKQGLKIADLVPYDTDTYHYLKVYEEYFTKCSQSAEVVIADRLDYADPVVQRNLLRFVRTMERTDHSYGVDFWLKDYLQFLHGSLALPTTDQWVYFLKSVFLTFPPFQKHNRSINFIPEPGGGYKIGETRFWVQMINMGLSNKTAAMYMLRNKIANAPKFGIIAKMYAFDVSFPLAEQYESIKPCVLENVFTAGGIILIISLFFIPDVLTCLTVAFSVLSINAGVVAFISLWGIRLDIVSLITILLSIGFSVDFASHVCYHYVHAPRCHTPMERVTWSLETVGWPILQSTLSTILGVSCIIFVNSYIAYTFVKTVVLVMTIGLYHGLVVLPVFLTLMNELHNLCCESTRKASSLNNVESDVVIVQDTSSSSGSGVSVAKQRSQKVPKKVIRKMVHKVFPSTAAPPTVIETTHPESNLNDSQNVTNLWIKTGLKKAVPLSQFPSGQRTTTFSQQPMSVSRMEFEDIRTFCNLPGGVLQVAPPSLPYETPTRLKNKGSVNQRYVL